MFGIDFNKLRFLICDDNAHMRRILRTLLHSFGAREAYEAEDGATALEMYIHYVPDIMILDWSMPIFDGLELAQMIRQPDGNGNPYTPIIMLTGHSDKRRVMMARDAGVTEFLAKPISAKALYQRIVNVVVSPRPFIKTKSYFGPDRRRNTTTAYIGPERRNGGKAEIIQQQALLDKARQRADRACEEFEFMAARERDKPAGKIEVETFADYQVIRQPNPLRRAVKRVAETDRDDPVARAEKALEGLSDEFEDWMRQGVRAARRGACSDPRRPASTATTQDELFRAAHDIKGDAATFGYPHGRGCRRQPVPDHGARAGFHEGAERADRAPCQCDPGDRARAQAARRRQRRRRALEEAARRRRRVSHRRQSGPPRASRSDPRPEHRAAGE